MQIEHLHRGIEIEKAQNVMFVISVNTCVLNKNINFNLAISLQNDHKITRYLLHTINHYFA